MNQEVLCPVCGKGKMEFPNIDSCENCGWTYDSVQYDLHDEECGENTLTVNEYREGLKLMGDAFSVREYEKIYFKGSHQKILDSHLSELSKISLGIDGYFRLPEKYVIYTDKTALENDYIALTADQGDFLCKSFCTMEPKKLISYLQKINLREWEPEYIDPCVLDGTQWTLILEFNGGEQSIEYNGSNAYPAEYKRLLSFFRRNCGKTKDMGGIINDRSYLRGYRRIEI